MYNYCFSAGNPEGTDYSLDMLHEQKYTEEEFKKLVEELLFEFAKARQEQKKKVDPNVEYIGKTGFDIVTNSRKIMEKFKEKGFTFLKHQASYYFEPYWGVNQIDHDELRRMIKN